MAEPVMRAMEIALSTTVATVGPRLEYHGLENLPASGGAVIALNHTGYVDWIPGSLGALRRGRRLRYMIKSEMLEVEPIGFLMRGGRMIPVDRSAGAGAYAVAVERLHQGEIVGVYPEATISRSFELKEFKTGAARMASEAGVPIIPFVSWGVHRLWTKDHKRRLLRNRVPIVTVVGGPLSPTDNVDQTTSALREAMTECLQRAQIGYEHPAGAYWVPRRLGGGAPTMAEAQAMEEAELAERARKKAQLQQTGGGKSRGRRARAKAARAGGFDPET